MPDSIRALTTDEHAVREIPEDRVRAFLDNWPPDDDVLAEADGSGNVYALAVTDVRDLLAEVAAWRALAGDRLDIIERLAEDLTKYTDAAPQEQTGGNA